jgi:hypothetical protein
VRISRNTGTKRPTWYESEILYKFSPRKEKSSFHFIFFFQVLLDWTGVQVVTERMAIPALVLAKMVSQVNQAILENLAMTDKKVLQAHPEFQAPLALQLLQLLQLQLLQLLVQLIRANQHQHQRLHRYQSAAAEEHPLATSRYIIKIIKQN